VPARTSPSARTRPRKTGSERHRRPCWRRLADPPGRLRADRALRTAVSRPAKSRCATDRPPTARGRRHARQRAMLEAVVEHHRCPRRTAAGHASGIHPSLAGRHRPRETMRQHRGLVAAVLGDDRGCPSTPATRRPAPLCDIRARRSRRAPARRSARQQAPPASAGAPDRPGCRRHHAGPAPAWIAALGVVQGAAKPHRAAVDRGDGTGQTRSGVGRGPRCGRARRRPQAPHPASRPAGAGPSRAPGTAGVACAPRRRRCRVTGAPPHGARFLRIGEQRRRRLRQLRAVRDAPPAARRCARRRLRWSPCGPTSAAARRAQLQDVVSADRRPELPPTNRRLPGVTVSERPSDTEQHHGAVPEHRRAAASAAYGVAMARSATRRCTPPGRSG
jgi:hypothetical protein